MLLRTPTVRPPRSARPMGRLPLRPRPVQPAVRPRAMAAPAAPPEVAGAFAGVKDMASFQAVLTAGAKAGKVPEMLVPAFMDFYNNYKSALAERRGRGGGRAGRGESTRPNRGGRAAPALG